MQFLRQLKNLVVAIQKRLNADARFAHAQPCSVGLFYPWQASLGAKIAAGDSVERGLQSRGVIGQKRVGFERQQRKRLAQFPHRPVQV